MTPAEFWRARAEDPTANHARVVADTFIVEGDRIDAHMRLLSCLPSHSVNANRLETQW